MENELTQHANLAYPVSRINMDENVEQEGQNLPKEVGKIETEKEKKAREAKANLVNVTALQKEKARRAWEEENKKREAKGEKITDAQKRVVQNLIERGIAPQAGQKGDGYFEHINAKKYEGTALEEIAYELKQLGKLNKVTNESTQDIVRQLDKIKNSAGVPPEKYDELVKEIREIGVAMNTGQPYIPSEGGSGGGSGNNNETTAGGEEDGGDDEGLSSRQKWLKRQEQFASKKERTSVPQSIQQVIYTIIADEGEDRWGENGAFPLVNEKGEINQSNFLKWVRERMLYHHFNNSRDFQLNLLNSVGVDNEYGSKIPIVKMIENRRQYFRDETTDEVLDDLADQSSTEVWLFGKSRNNGLLYQFWMSSDSKLPEFLSQVHQNEEFTSGKNFERIMTMPNEYKLKEEGSSEEKTDTSIGDSVRRAYEIYYYISDYDKLRELLNGTKGEVFFKKETFIDAYKIIEGKEKSEDISDEAKANIDLLFEKNGDIKVAPFIEFLNPFNNQNKPGENIELAREVIRRTISEMYDLDYGLGESAKESTGVNGKKNPSRRSLKRTNLTYAELWAWSMARWTGAGARNDTSAIGFDAFTKTTKFRDYRVRQSDAGRAGQFGNQYDIPVFKSLTRDFFNGIWIEKKLEDEGVPTTPFEVFEQLDAIEKRKDLSNEEKIKLKKEKAERFRFEQFTQLSYASNHINRSFEVFHSMMGAEELRLEEIVKRDPFQGIILDRAKFEEQVKEKFLKPMRYAFSTYPQLDYGRMTRVQIGKDKAGLPIYKEVTVADSMFGAEVLNGLRPMAEEYYKKKLNKRSLSDEEKKAGWSAYLSDSDSKAGGRRHLWKRAAMARIALDLKSHREWGNGYQFFNMEMVEKFYEALETIKAVDIVGEDGDETLMKYGERFLTKEDIEWIRKHSKTGFKGMVLKELVLKDGGLGLLKGTWDGMNDFVKDIFK
jgi:hypothetical protein